MTVEPSTTALLMVDFVKQTCERRPRCLASLPDVKKLLAGISFENQALALPAHMQSRFSVECDIATKHEMLFGREPDFNIYYALAHYHTLGTKLTIEAMFEQKKA